jgi:hypothetical protein
MTGTRCDSCGDEGTAVIAVRRHYVTPESWDTPGRVEVVDEVEHWCLPCRTHYPHEVLGSEEAEVGGGQRSPDGDLGVPPG